VVLRLLIQLSELHQGVGIKARDSRVIASLLCLNPKTYITEVALSEILVLFHEAIPFMLFNFSIFLFI